MHLHFYNQIWYWLLYLKWITNRVLLYSTEDSAQCYVAAGWEGSLGENGYMHMYGWVPLLSTWKYHIIVNHILQYKSFLFLFLKRMLNSPYESHITVCFKTNNSTRDREKHFIIVWVNTLGRLYIQIL